MALPPARTNGSELSKGQEIILDQFEAGQNVHQIATKLAKGNKRTRNRLARQIYRMLQTDRTFQEAIFLRSRGILLAGLPAAMAGQVRRAGRGRTDAAKLVAEATQFHNPRVSHEHSGDIKITIDMPRPKFVDATAEED